MKAKVILVFLCLVLVVGGFASLLRPKPGPMWPPAFVSSPSSAVANQTISVTVTMQAANSTDEALYLSAPSGILTNLPSQVTVPHGATTVSFNVTLSSSATGAFAITAWNEVGSAESNGTVVWSH